MCLIRGVKEKYVLTGKYLQLCSSHLSFSVYLAHVVGPSFIHMSDTIRVVYAVRCSKSLSFSHEELLFHQEVGVAAPPPHVRFVLLSTVVMKSCEIQPSPCEGR
jgi:hypothetical protein